MNNDFNNNLINNGISMREWAKVYGYKEKTVYSVYYKWFRDKKERKKEFPSGGISKSIFKDIKDFCNEK
jgi:hypothetical protein